jgi:hypothetical protein
MPQILNRRGSAQATKERQRRGMIVFSKVPGLLRPAADRTDSVLSWILAEVSQMSFSGLVRFLLCKEWRLPFGLFVNRRSKQPNVAC